MIEKMGKQNCRQICPRRTWAYQPEGHFKRQSPETIRSTPDIRTPDPQYAKTGPPVYEDWNPDARRMDPRCPRPQDPAFLQTRTKDHAGSGTLWDSELCGIRDFARIQDFVGFETSRNPGLRGIHDFVGSRTSWDSRLHRIRDFVGLETSRDSGLHGI